jgi:hypothetical protein
MQLGVAVLLVSVSLLYPTLRAAGLVPTTAIVDLARPISTDRAGSAEARFTNEDKLLERAYQRFWFGWGRFGRNLIYDENGNDVHLTDGTWIITIGTFGFIGFLAEFGLLALPVFAAARALRFAESSKDKFFLSALALILAINIFDLLPNSPLTAWTWLITGALLGRAETLRQYARLQKRFVTEQPVGYVGARKEVGAIR